MKYLSLYNIVNFVAVPDEKHCAPVHLKWRLSGVNSREAVRYMCRREDFLPDQSVL